MKLVITKVLLVALLINAFLVSETVFGNDVQPVDEREVDLVWSTSDGQRLEIFYANKQKGVWTEPVRITDDYYDNMYPVIDRDSTGKRWVFWSAYNNGRMELRYTTGENNEWRDSEILADAMKTNISPSVIIDKQDTVWLVWSANNGDLDDIFFTFNVQDSWSEPAHLHAENTVLDMLPEIELDDSAVPMVNWQTLHDGKPTTLTSTFSNNEWSEPQVKETNETSGRDDGALELPSFVNNSSMVFVRVY